MIREETGHYPKSEIPLECGPRHSRRTEIFVLLQDIADRGDEKLGGELVA